MKRKRFYESPAMDCESLVVGDVLQVSDGEGLVFGDGSYSDGFWE